MTVSHVKNSRFFISGHACLRKMENRGLQKVDCTPWSLPLAAITAATGCADLSGHHDIRAREDWLFYEAERKEYSYQVEMNLRKKSGIKRKKKKFTCM